MEAMELLMQVVRIDPPYQELYQQNLALEEDYLRIMASLPEADRDLLERYISVCENMEYRKVCLAIALWGPK